MLTLTGILLWEIAAQADESHGQYDAQIISGSLLMELCEATFQAVADMHQPQPTDSLGSPSASSTRPKYIQNWLENATNPLLLHTSAFSLRPVCPRSLDTFKMGQAIRRLPLPQRQVVGILLSPQLANRVRGIGSLQPYQFQIRPTFKDAEDDIGFQVALAT